ncbi:hypothetical protein [Paenibacillus roseipurpureus]|uniref:Uncharacterized protein n=1 Tax=Paenibacillus roseopurpureus TaxID=2918901 RepID=A0AA96RLY7_9BACL|nr:hypothetical protein [Paenibacillus sp. MBLB1832]WNR43657.1 hypothetical protein MJB10_21530 [Paenibacillus sp. MBLB1832]
MFNFFKRNKKENLKVNITLEEQIETLCNLGISFDDYASSSLVENLLFHFERECYEENPFILLLTTIGSDLFDENDKEIRMSKDVWNFDTEFIEDESIYNILVRNFVELTQGDLPLNNIDSRVDFDQEEASISFELDGKNYHWPIEFNDDWFDFELIRILAKQANNRNKSKMFIYFTDGQSLTILYCDKTVFNKLNDLTDNKFNKLA